MLTAQKKLMTSKQIPNDLGILSRFPDEVLLNMLSNFSIAQLANFRLVNKRAHGLAWEAFRYRLRAIFIKQFAINDCAAFRVLFDKHEALDRLEDSDPLHWLAAIKKGFEVIKNMIVEYEEKKYQNELSKVEKYNFRTNVWPRRTVTRNQDYSQLLQKDLTTLENIQLPNDIESCSSILTFYHKSFQGLPFVCLLRLYAGQKQLDRIATAINAKLTKLIEQKSNLASLKFYQMKFLVIFNQTKQLAEQLKVSYDREIIAELLELGTWFGNVEIYSLLHNKAKELGLTTEPGEDEADHLITAAHCGYFKLVRFIIENNEISRTRLKAALTTSIGRHYSNIVSYLLTIFQKLGYKIPKIDGERIDTLAECKDYAILKLFWPTNLNIKDLLPTEQKRLGEALTYLLETHRTNDIPGLRYKLVTPKEYDDIYQQDLIDCTQLFKDAGLAITDILTEENVGREGKNRSFLTPEVVKKLISIFTQPLTQQNANQALQIQQLQQDRQALVLENREQQKQREKLATKLEAKKERCEALEKELDDLRKQLAATKPSFAQQEGMFSENAKQDNAIPHVKPG